MCATGPIESRERYKKSCAPAMTVNVESPADNPLIRGIAAVLAWDRIRIDVRRSNEHASRWKLNRRAPKREIPQESVNRGHRRIFQRPVISACVAGCRKSCVLRKSYRQRALNAEDS